MAIDDLLWLEFPMGLLPSGGPTPLLLDKFLADIAAGSVDGTAATPGPGTRTVQADSSNLLSIADLELKFNGGSYGDPYIHWGQVSRAQGLGLFYRLVSGSIFPPANIAFDPSLGGNALDGPGLYAVFATSSVYISGTGLTGKKVSTGTTYKHFLTLLRSTGAFLLGSIDNTTWVLLATEASTAQASYYIAATNSTIADGRLNSISLYQLPTNRPTLYPIPAVSHAANTLPTITDKGSNGLDGTPANTGLNGASARAFESIAIPPVTLLSQGFDPNEGAVFVRVRMLDFTGNPIFLIVGRDAAANFMMLRWTAVNGLYFWWEGNNVTKEHHWMPALSKAPFGMGMTFSYSGDAVVGYYNGAAKSGASLSGLTEWVDGALSATYTGVGKLTTFNGPVYQVIITLNGVKPSAADAAWLTDPNNVITAAELDARIGAGNYLWYDFTDQYLSDGAAHVEGATTPQGDGVVLQAAPTQWDVAGDTSPVAGSDMMVPDVWLAATTGWQVYAANTVVTLAGENGVRVTYVNDYNGAYAYFNGNPPVLSNPSYGLVYECVFEARRPGGNNNEVEIVGGSYYAFKKGSADTNWLSYTVNWVRVGHTGNAYLRARVNSTGSTDIRNVTLKRLTDVVELQETGRRDVVISADLTADNNGELIGLVVGAEGADETGDYIGVLLARASGSIVVYEKDSTNAIQLANVAITYSAGARLEVQRSGQSITVLYNGASVTTVTLSKTIEGTKHGKIFAGEGNALIENLQIYADGNNWYEASNRAYMVPVVGPELLTNGGFSAWTGDDPDGWTVTGESGSDPEMTERDPDQHHADTKTTGEAANFYSSATAYPRLSQAVLVDGDYYQVSCIGAAPLAGNIQVYLGGYIGEFSISTYSLSKTSRATGTSFELRPSGAIDYTVDSASVKKLPFSTLLRSVALSAGQVIAQVNLTLTAGMDGGLVINLDSATNPQNCIRVFYGRLYGKVYAQEMINGVWQSDSFAVTATYSAGAQFEVRRIGNAIYVWYNKTYIGTFTATVANTNTAHAVFLTDNDSYVDNFIVWPTTGYDYGDYE